MSKLEAFLLDKAVEHGLDKSLISFKRKQGFLSLHVKVCDQSRDLVEPLWDALADINLDSVLSDGAEESLLSFYKPEAEMEALLGFGPFQIQNQILAKANIPICFSWSSRHDQTADALDPDPLKHDIKNKLKL